MFFFLDYHLQIILWFWYKQRYLDCLLLIFLWNYWVSKVWKMWKHAKCFFTPNVCHILKFVNCALQVICLWDAILTCYMNRFSSNNDSKFCIAQNLSVILLVMFMFLCWSELSKIVRKIGIRTIPGSPFSKSIIITQCLLTELTEPYC